MESKIYMIIAGIVCIYILSQIIIYPLLYFTTRRKFDQLLINEGYPLPLNLFFYVPDSVGRVLNYTNLIAIGPTTKVLKQQFVGFNFKKHASRFDIILCLVNFILSWLTIISLIILIILGAIQRYN